MLDWLGLSRRTEKGDTCLRERKTLEMFGYVVRTILQSIVIEAVRLSEGELRPVGKPIELGNYQKAAAGIKD